MLQRPLSRPFTARASRQLLPLPRSGSGQVVLIASRLASLGLRISLVSALVMNALEQYSCSESVVDPLQKLKDRWAFIHLLMKAGLTRAQRAILA